MWSRKPLDIGWLDLAAGVLGVLSPLRPRVADAPHVVTCLSVRSGFDLLLGALDLPRGSEVVISAITIPDHQPAGIFNCRTPACAGGGRYHV